ncbi:MAG: HAMP domain-containing protein [Deltaproteobacteria bacterium]|nr:HAMP domain-containing protein [Deltaproteobacteria bacterium]
MMSAGRLYPRTTGPSCQWPSRARSLRSKMIISMAIVFGLVCFSTISALYSLSRVADKITLIELSYELNQKVLETRRYEKNFLLYQNHADLSNALDYIDQVRFRVSHLKDVAVLSGEEIAVYRTQLEDYADVLKQLSKLNGPPPTEMKQRVRELGQSFTEYIMKLDAEARLEAENDAQRYRHFSLASMQISIFLGGIFAFFLIRWVTEPLEYLRKAATRIRNGELSVIPMDPAVRGSLEGVELVNSLNLMLGSLVEKQEALIQSAKLATIGEVTAGLAHEVNNPLNNISLTAEVLLEDLPEEEGGATREMVAEILAQTERAREVVQNLLVFIRKAKITDPVVMDVVQLAENSVGLLKNQLRLSQIEVKTDFPAGPVKSSGFPSQIEQVLVNIMLNAIQAMGPGGCLTVRVLAMPEQQAGVVEITDTGPGISSEDRKRIFDPFFTTKSDGTGLGLSVSYSIIEKHGGVIGLESEPGRGTIFRIALPLVDSEDSRRNEEER